MQPRRPQVSDYLALEPEPDLDLQVKEKLIYNVFAPEKKSSTADLQTLKSF
jgi:hypothetical protein